MIVREGKNLKGRALGLLLVVAGKRVLGKELDKTTVAISGGDDQVGGVEQRPPLDEHLDAVQGGLVAIDHGVVVVRPLTRAPASPASIPNTTIFCGAIRTRSAT